MTFVSKAFTMCSVLLMICCVVHCVEGIRLLVEVRYPSSSLPEPSTDTLWLRGSGLGLSWTTGQAMKRERDDTWTYEVNYTADNVSSILDFKAMLNDEYYQIGANSMVALPSVASRVTTYPWFYTFLGSYGIVGSLSSTVLNNTRDVIVYTPPSYTENTLKPMENVLIMHDGENLFNASTSFAGIAWDCQDTINALVAEGRMEEVFIIGLYNTLDRLDDYTYSYDPTVKGGGKGDAYLDFIENKVIPFAVNKFPRLRTGKENLGMMGSSLGGLISCYAGWTRDIYGKVGCMSSSFWWNSQDFNNTVLTSTWPRHTSNVSFYLDSGNAGPDNDDEQQTITVRNHIESLGWKMNHDLFYYMEDGGRHGELWWGKRFHVPMTDLYPPLPTPTMPINGMSHM